MKVLKTSSFAIVRNHYCSQKYVPGKKPIRGRSGARSWRIASNCIPGGGEQTTRKEKNSKSPRYARGGCYQVKVNHALILTSPQGSLLCTADAFRVTWSEKVLRASPGPSSRISHRNALTERAWKVAVQGLGKH